MATAESPGNVADKPTGNNPAVELEAGTYEVIRNRLLSHGKDLRSRINQLNGLRKEVFGSIETTLLGTERVTTEHNCVPRDLVAVGTRFIFGYNVRFGLKTETKLTDVFSVYEFADNSFHEKPLDLITDPNFIRDFKELYKYYKETTFAKFSIIGPYLFMVFRVGRGPRDIKTFKWALQNGEIHYIDNRSDHEFKFPSQHEFEWVKTKREQHQRGEHPHISIEDRVFVETVGGDLTIKVENNTASGGGIYAEDVDDKDQGLDDADIYYAILGNIILLKIRPYQEKAFRYFAFNEKIQQAIRLDAIADACVLLPDDHGLIFSNGYYLQNGEYKTFENDLTNMIFERKLQAPNGEDYLFSFYDQEHGTSILLPYNLIQQQVDTPIICHGYSFFPDGELVCFKRQDDPQKHHALQIWKTPYVGDDYVLPEETDSFLYKIGNKDIVRGMAEATEIVNLIHKEDTYGNLYVDLVKKSTDVMDSYFWIGKEETFNLKAALGEIRKSAESAIGEFEKVIKLKRNTAEESKRVQQNAEKIIKATQVSRFEHINDFVTSLAELRKVRGEIISLKELRYVDLQMVESLETQIKKQADNLSYRCVEFLLQDNALTPYLKKVDAQQATIPDLTKVADAKLLEAEIGQTGHELEMLIEIVSNLKIDDATQRTTIIDNISAIFSKLNQARSTLKNKTQELASEEGVAEFSSSLKLINQSVVNYLDICDTPEKCEEYLTKLMIQLEELEGRFAEFDEFVLQITEKREEVYSAFDNRKLGLVEARNKRASSMVNAAERILNGIKNRVEKFESVNEINGYFAADLMIEKVRDLISQLVKLDDSVRADDIQSRLKTIREDAVRQLKDRQELFVDGENVIRMGTRKFSVNVQELDLTTIRRDGEYYLHLTGTNFFERIEDPRLLETKQVWDQIVVSETPKVYRGEYLAYQLMQSLSHPNAEVNSEELAKMEEKAFSAYIQKFMGPRYEEGYSKGVHDHDAGILFKKLLDLDLSIQLMRYAPKTRALAAVFWSQFSNAKAKKLLNAKYKSFANVQEAFPEILADEHYIHELEILLEEFANEEQLFPVKLVPSSAQYLFHELMRGGKFTISHRAATIYREFLDALEHQFHKDKYDLSLKRLASHPFSKFRLLRDWVSAFVDSKGTSDDQPYIDEVASILLSDRFDDTQVIQAELTQDLSGFVGSHPLIQSGKYHFDYLHFQDKLNEHVEERVPRFHQFVELKKHIVESTKKEMRLKEFEPRVLTSFVRNKLIDSVYLPLIGDNLAKQVGEVGDQKRTDLMGLLLLISPPGYGKTTLMEYVSNRLGLIFMKINGPAIGHQVTSLDPMEASNASSREEVEKLNLAFEMGDNVMIYVDDIQHCNPEFLQKFISLCDGQRKIEGVYKGETRTYDLRGRKVMVVMAGNPYTESGEKFQIPDMLANRADTYNLGEIIGETADVFKMSYLENSLTSNPILSKLASRNQKDIYAVINMAEGRSREEVEFEGNYSLEELNEFVDTMKKLLRVRDIILAVNQQYIASAAQADAYRTEPPFKLQGSYRNMNRIAEKVLPIMNDKELDSLIMTQYENDAQTLTSGAESNLLKFKELFGNLTAEESERWADMKRTFKRNNLMQGVSGDDKFGQVIVQLSAFNEGLSALRDTLTNAVAKMEGSSENQVEALMLHLESFNHGLERIASHLSDSSPSTINASLDANTLEAFKEIVSALPTGNGEISGEKFPKRIQIINKVPDTIVNVLQHQFELMQGWMEPVLNTTNLQRGEILQLKEKLDDTLQQFHRLMSKVSNAPRAESN